MKTNAVRRLAGPLVAAMLIPGIAIAWQQAKSAPPAQTLEGPRPQSPRMQDEARSRAALGLLLAQYDRTHDPALLPRIDAAAGQHDAAWSRLYWYTDLEEAKAAARAEHKPILYLRLLGKLTDEYSCANSRFFRTVLYANESISQLLRDRFVLVWESERPVPVVTIDYGDGRTLKRTITGNSIHYVLDADGRVIDALPGLYDPDTFRYALSRILEVGPTRAARVAHAVSTAAELERAWQTELASLASGRGEAPSARPSAEPAKTPDAVAASRRAESKTLVERPLLEIVRTVPVRDELAAAFPNAAAPMPLAMSKGAAEAPILRATSPQFARDLDGPTSDGSVYARLAAAHAPTVRLDQNSIALMRSKNPLYENPDRLRRVLDQFRLTLAQDTLRGNLDFRRTILGWLRRTPDVSLADLNARVYAELFLTPRSDPWLGLKSDEVYSALDGDGCSSR